MEKLKKCTKYLLLLGLMIGTFVISYESVVKADTLEFSNWYSTSRYVGYWEEDPKVYCTTISETVNVINYVNKAWRKWCADVLEDTNITMAPTNADIRFYSGTRKQLNALGLNYTSNHLGMTYYETSGRINPSSDYYGVYKMSTAIASVCDEAGASMYEGVVLHEFGHALGWFGHSYVEGDVMHSSVETGNETMNTTLKTKEIQHLKQVYDKLD